MNVASILSDYKIPEKISLTSTTSTWNKQITWKLDNYTDKLSALPYIENVPYNLFMVNTRVNNLVDGRGFSLKMNGRNLPFLLLHAKIRCGRIVEPCQYILVKRTFWLVPTRMITGG